MQHTKSTLMGPTFFDCLLFYKKHDAKITFNLLLEKWDIYDSVFTPTTHYKVQKKKKTSRQDSSKSILAAGALSFLITDIQLSLWQQHIYMQHPVAPSDFTTIELATACERKHSSMSEKEAQELDRV